MGAAYVFFKWIHFFFLSIKTPKSHSGGQYYLFRQQNLRLCKWPAPGLLCASIHYHHKAVDVSPLCLFCAKHGVHQPVHYRPVTRAAWEMAKQRGMSAWS